MQEPIQSGGRYPALRTIAVLYLIISGVVAIAGIVYAFYLLFATAGPWGNRVAEFFGTLAVTFFASLTAVAISEVIKLFIDVAHSARAVASPTTEPNPSRYPNRMKEYANEETAEGALMRGR